LANLILASPPPKSLTYAILGLVRPPFRKVGGKSMNKFKANQKLLFKAEIVFSLKPLEKYEILFSFLDTSSLSVLYPATGRPHISVVVILSGYQSKQ